MMSTYPAYVGRQSEGDIEIAVMVQRKRCGFGGAFLLGVGVAAKATRQNATKRQRAAILLAEDELSDEAIAATVKVHRATLDRWKNDPEFAALVGDHRGHIVAQALKLPIAKKHKRVAELNDLNERYHRVINSRAERYAAVVDTAADQVRRIFGSFTPEEAATGMLVEQQKISAGGQTVTDWVFDKALDSAIKETHKQAAQELGQWEETLNVNHGGTVQQEYIIVQDVPWADEDDD